MPDRRYCRPLSRPFRTIITPPPRQRAYARLTILQVFSPNIVLPPRLNRRSSVLLSPRSLRPCRRAFFGFPLDFSRCRVTIKTQLKNPSEDKFVRKPAPRRQRVGIWKPSSAALRKSLNGFIALNRSIHVSVNFSESSTSASGTKYSTYQDLNLMYSACGFSLS